MKPQLCFFLKNVSSISAVQPRFTKEFQGREVGSWSRKSEILDFELSF